ncbi:MAG: DUF2267 domain-containing protein [Leptolyngbyaceae cyanobacterium MO_188.B28]|nr:DUF2267 domain-containing protein [Leptolyngbyaceae cyanobacterium MO_188.B28]
MKYNEFTKHVQSFSQTDSLDEAERAIRATLETLAERIQGDAASKVAEQLPEEMHPYLRGQEGQTSSPFTLQEFYQRVSQKEGIDPATAVMHVRGVFAVLNAAVPPEEFGEVQTTLSDDYEELFAASNKVLITKYSHD